MVDPVLARRWGHRLAYLGLAALFFFLRILPLDTRPGGWPGPDLMLALTLAWVLRRPDCVPAPLIVAVMLMDDMLCQRPPGLMAALALIGTEFLRGRIALLRGRPFLAEWAMVAAVTLAMVLASRLVLALALVPQAGLAQDMARALATLLVYPAVAGLSQLALLRGAGETEMLRT